MPRVRRYKRQTPANGQDIPVGMELRIKALRKTLGLTQDELARMAGISRNYLSEIETGKKTPNVTRLEQIAKPLKKNWADLLVNPEQDLRALRLMAALEKAPAQDWEDVIRHAEALKAVRPATGGEEGSEE
jgi:transcriptional regulator with XRE-family HTH domain